MGVSTTRWVRPLAWATLVANATLVVTGGAVRLTGSGLGCPTWPRCTDSSFRPHGALSLHQAVEFGNRTLAGVVLAFALILTVLLYTARRRGLTPRRSAALVRLGMTIVAVVLIQAVLGGMTVWFELHPALVASHFALSGALVALCMTLSMTTVAIIAVQRIMAGGMVPQGGGVMLGAALNIFYGAVNFWVLSRWRARGRDAASPLVRSQICLFSDKLSSNVLIAAALAATMTLGETAPARFIDPAASLLIAAATARTRCASSGLLRAAKRSSCAKRRCWPRSPNGSRRGRSCASTGA